MLVGGVACVALLSLLVIRRPPQTPLPQPSPPQLTAASPAPESAAARSPEIGLPVPGYENAFRTAESPEAVMARLLSTSSSDKMRRAAALDVARLGTEEALNALRKVLADPSAASGLKAAIAEALGECPHPDARALLHRLTGTSDESIARGALRGLAAIGDSVAIRWLSSFLESDATPADLRVEAALALGTIDDPLAFNALTSVLPVDDPNLTRGLLEAIGQQHFDQSRGFFTEYLGSSEVPPSLRAAALEAIGRAPGEVAPFLLQFASDPDPEARAAAAWALSVTGQRAAIGAELVQLLRAESDAKVRLRLYQALGSQQNFDLATVQQFAESEPEISVRLEAYHALARTIHTPEAAAHFDQHAVPQLAEVAVTGTTLQHRLTSVVALQRARTPAARAALASVAQNSSDARVIEAARVALGAAAPHHSP